MGGFVVMRYGVRHPGHAGALILLSTLGRFDIGRLVEGFRRAAGDEVAESARRDYDLDPVSDDEWARVFAAFGPNVPDAETLARRTRNKEVAEVGMALMRRFDTLDALASITSPTLVCVGDLDPVTPVAAAREIVEALPPGVGRLAVIERAGHFSWLDEPRAVPTSHPPVAGTPRSSNLESGHDPPDRPAREPPRAPSTTAPPCRARSSTSRPRCMRSVRSARRSGPAGVEAIREYSARFDGVAPDDIAGARARRSRDGARRGSTPPSAPGWRSRSAGCGPPARPSSSRTSSPSSAPAPRHPPQGAGRPGRPLRARRPGAAGLQRA